ncbi:MAG: polysaccharide deacetylase family protein, partial [Romboutsia sp.]|nr:polysaccharide deacetylase family protein [Romboutsia sp.]
MNIRILRKASVLAIIFTILISFNKDVDAHTNEGLFIKSGSRDKKIIALTFDDGPHPKETDRVLDVLSKYNVKATFFIAGKHAKWYTDPLVRASKEGHEIGNHTFTHPDISNLTSQQIESEILECEKTLVEITGEKPTLFRPPFGSYKKEELEEIARKNNYKIILWTTVDARDWQNPPASKIASKIIDNAKNGDIILLHDYATENTVEALDILIPAMQT